MKNLEVILSEEIEELIENLEEESNRGVKKARTDLKRIYFYFNILESVGTRGGENYTKYIVDDIWELRPGKYRFMFTIVDNYILLTYFKKDSKKTPKHEIDRAKKALKDWRDKR